MDDEQPEPQPEYEPHSPVPIDPRDITIYIDPPMVIEHKSMQQIGVYASTPVGIVHGYLHRFVPSIEQAAQYMDALLDARDKKWSASLGYTLTREQANQLDITITELAQTGVYPRWQYEQHLLTVLRAVSSAAQYQEYLNEKLTHTALAMQALSGDCSMTFVNGSYYSNPYAQPNYDHWWFGLERQCANSERASGRTNQRGRTYGKYRYSHSGRQSSYWRHTRTR